jgi:SagB-type dehydrogenase family enzyme
MARHTELWSLRDDVSLDAGSGDAPLRLSGRWGEVAIARPSGDIRELLARMRLGPISLENVSGVRGDDRATVLARLHRVLDHLQPLVIRTLARETGQPLISVVPITSRSRFHPVPLAPGVRVRLSSFAQLRTNGTEFVVESPLALHRVVLHRSEAVCLVGALGRFVTADEAATAAGRDRGFAADLLGYLRAAGMLSSADADPELAGWSPGDLMFHTRSTLGRHDHDFGATYPSGNGQCPEPVVKQRRAGTGIALHRPRWEELRCTDPPFTAVLEARRSVREQGSSPVTAEELGDLLYRAARVRSLIAASAGDEPALSDRPYPGGGARYELELYVTVHQCAGLAPGVYHYDPAGHQLEPLDTDAAAGTELLGSARVATGMDRLPSVLITITARFLRVSWKYEGLPYALVLMDAGALIQTLYLVCTAMRLAPCAIGSVYTDVAARAFGTDWRVEPGVAQLVVNRAGEPVAEDTGFWRPVNDASWRDRAAAMLKPCYPPSMLSAGASLVVSGAGCE